jgi:hypothetical protein
MEQKRTDYKEKENKICTSFAYAKENYMASSSGPIINFYGEGVFHTKQTKIWPSLGQIGSVVSEKKIFEKVYRWITNAFLIKCGIINC